MITVNQPLRMSDAPSHDSAGSCDPPQESVRLNVCVPTHEEIAVCAYRIWLSEGCPQGQCLRHWIEAEEQLRMCCWHDIVHRSEA